MSRSKGWCFTINNPEETDVQEVAALTLHKHRKYIVYGIEKGEKEGTPHIQGYCFMNVEKSRKAMSEILSRAYLTPARGSAEDNFNYCSKQGDFTEVGVRPISAKRKGDLGREYWDDVKKKAKEGRLDEIDSKVFITHFSSLTKIASKYAPMPPDLEEVENEWYYGPTGTGKSMKARTENPGAYLKMCNKWWDGYAGEDVVIIEDLDKSHHVLGHHLKIWADRYAFPAEVKGAKLNLRPKKIIVTSNYSPADVWPGDTGTLEPILRRFKISHFSGSLKLNST